MTKTLLISLVIAFGILSAPNLYSQKCRYEKVGAWSWKHKLTKYTKGKQLQTFNGSAITPGNELTVHVMQPAGSAQQRDDRKMWGGLYQFQLVVYFDNNGNQIPCKKIKEGSINPNNEKRLALVTTRLNGSISNGACLSVTGSYDDCGNFVCKKIIDVQTGVTIVCWDDEVCR